MIVKKTILVMTINLLIIALCSGGIMNHGILEAGQEISLPDPAEEGKMSVEKAISQRRSTRNFSDDPLTLDLVSQILWSAQGITEKRQNFRTAPSAGATFPLEIFLVSGKIEGLKPGVYRYLPLNHSLSKIMNGDQRHALYAGALHQSAIINAPASVIIGGVFERTTNRYGARGEQYVYMEVGHAGQNIHLQAEALGLGTVVIGAFDDSRVQQALNLPLKVIPISIMPFGK